MFYNIMSVKCVRPNFKISCCAFDMHTQHLLDYQEQNVCLKLKQRQINTSSSSSTVETKQEPQQVGQIQQGQELFELAKQWYPVYTTMHLDGEGLTPIQLVGKNLVLWKDDEDNWRCCEDSSTLKFTDYVQGEQATDAQSEAVPCVQVKVAAKEFPARQKFGLLWIWGGSLAEFRTSQPKKTDPQTLSNFDDFSNSKQFGSSFLEFMKVAVWAGCAVLATAAVFNATAAAPLNINTIQMVQFKAVFYTFFAIILGFVAIIVVLFQKFAAKIFSSKYQRVQN